jgi:hypothetical protein
MPVPKTVSARFALNAVVDVFGGHHKDITSAEDGPRARYLRCAAMRLINEKTTGLQPDEVGKFLGGRSARQVQLGRIQARKLMKKDPTFCKNVEEAQREIDRELSSWRYQIAER